jgi:hypothetical protein
MSIQNPWIDQSVGIAVELTEHMELQPETKTYHGHELTCSGVVVCGAARS